MSDIKSQQLRRLGQLLLRTRGVTALEIINEIGTVCPHRRLADLRNKGWTISRNAVTGQSYGRYFGVAPK
jgi:hypothetical protein